MPTIPSIKTSVENKDVLVMDEHAKQGTFKRDARGRLMSYAGGFSVVFPYQIDNGEKWAFRCWHADVNNTQKRYETIAHAITDARLDFLCDFEYVEKGINVEGKIYPTTRMRWVDGISLKDYICKHRDSKEKLRRLADNFLQMTRALHEKSLAHGDLQHGNILVSDDDKLHLVDYDSFYCPKLKGEMDTVTGLPDYQHPSRATNKTVSEKLDYFSELVIYLSILAIAKDATLIDKYQVADADRLLFEKEDYTDIKDSHIYKDIFALGKEFQELLGVLEEYLRCNTIHALSPFETCQLKNKIEFRASTIKAVRNKQVVIIEWNVPFEAEIYIKGNGDIKKCENKGKLSTTLAKDTVFELSVKIVDGREVKEQVSIAVFDECSIDFKADKYYVFPSIPVKLTWTVKNAKKVWLDDVEVKSKGTKIVDQSRATTYVLKAEDEFGIKEQKIEIQMLPVPQVKTLLVPTPDITNNLSVTIQQPRYNVEVRFPQIDIGFIKAEVPKVPSLTDMGINVKLTSPLPKFSLKETIKNIYHHIVN